jgi:nucleoside 2-deoxyribosyltransferase
MRTYRVYLAGPIWGTADPVTWRQVMTRYLPEGWEAVDPTQLQVSEDPREIVRADLTAIRTCEAVIARIDRPSWGTAMEIFYAHSKKIPIIGWYQDGVMPSMSIWVEVHCDTITSDFRVVKRFLQNLLAKA